MLWRSSVKNYQLALQTAAIVAVIVAIRALLFAVGVEGIQPSALASSIIAGGVFVMGLVIAGTLSDYRDAERAPTDLAGGLNAILRETESMHRVWGKPDMGRIRDRLVNVVDCFAPRHRRWGHARVPGGRGGAVGVVPRA